MDDTVIHVDDFIRDDGSIDALIEKLNKLNTTIGNLVGTAKIQGKELSDSIRRVKTSTAEGRKELAETIPLITGYQQVGKTLREVLSEASRQIKTLQDKLQNADGASKKHIDSLNAIGRGYIALIKDGEALVSLWSSLTTKEKKSSDALNLFNVEAQKVRSSLANLTKEVNSTVREINALRETEKKLEFVNSEAYKRIQALNLEIKKKAQETAMLDKYELELAATTQKLELSEAGLTQDLAEAKLALKKAEESAKLLAAQNLAAAGSYDELKAKYQAAKIAFNALPAMAREGSEGQALQANISYYKQQMMAIEYAEKEATKLEQAYLNVEASLDKVSRTLISLQNISSGASSKQQFFAIEASKQFNDLREELRLAVTQWEQLDAVQRQSTEGAIVKDNITALQAKLAEFDTKIKEHITILESVAKAREQLEFLQSEEGKSLQQLKVRISEVTAANKEEYAVEKARADLKSVGYTDEEIDRLQLQAKELQKLAALEIEITNTKVNSYNNLAKQYEINKIKLNAMTTEERNSTEEGKALVEETRNLYIQMQKLQEATGNYKLNVGNYGRIWNGLQNSVQQIVRELPAAAVSLNTFFLAISNNIPILQDEIERLKRNNEEAAKRGEETIPIMEQIVQSLFSWRSAIVVLLFVLSKYGRQIFDWLTRIFTGIAKLPSVNKQIEAISEAVLKNNDNLGKNISSLKRLQQEWNKLTSDKEKLQFIRDNADVWRELDIEINNVNDAENLLVRNTDGMIEALKLRALAAAAAKKAAEQYEKSVSLMTEAESKESEFVLDEQGRIKIDPETGQLLRKKKAPSAWNKFLAWLIKASAAGELQGQALVDFTEEISPEKIQEEFISATKAAALTAENLGMAYTELELQFTDMAAKLKESLGLEDYHKKGGSGSGSKRERDLTDTIFRNQITIRRKYEQSITALTQDEYTKRNQALRDQVANENRELMEMYRRNEDYVNDIENKYKELTDEEKKMIAEQQAWIEKTVANNLKKLDLQIRQLTKEQMANVIKLRRELVKDLDFGFAEEAQATVGEEGLTVTAKRKAGGLYDIIPNLDDVKASLLEERNLMMQHLAIERDMAIMQNRELIDINDIAARDEKDIILEYNKKALEIYSKYDLLILNSRKSALDEQLKLVEDGTQKQLDLLIKQKQLEQEIALAQNAAKPAEQQVSSEDIKAGYKKEIVQITAEFELKGFEKIQEQEKAAFDTMKHSADQEAKFEIQQEIAKWEKKIEIAKLGYEDLDEEGKAYRDKEIKYYQDSIKAATINLQNATNLGRKISERGLTGQAEYSIFESLNFNEEEIQRAMAATEEWANKTIGFINDIMAAEVELAEKQVELAEKRVEAMQKAYDAEVEARNNGYANNVATAKKELQLEKKNLAEKQKELEKAQKNQEKIQSLTQASSLITASANIWSSLSGIPIVGPALAMAMIGTMWASFAAAKIKARQVTVAQQQEYGEGGLEFLEGGSHASGNDIDLQTTNSKGKNMRAEGGEALAIINKRNTRKYKKVLPDVIRSLNRGTFEDKYLRAFENGETLRAQIVQQDASTMIDLTKLENDVREIKKQGQQQIIPLGNGAYISINKNVKTVVR